MKIKQCDKCKRTYEDNKKFNLVKCGLDKKVPPGMAIGYLDNPIINGIVINSSCGTGDTIDLCDDCILKLLDFLNNKVGGKKYERRNRTGCMRCKRRTKI